MFFSLQAKRKFTYVKKNNRIYIVTDDFLSLYLVIACLLLWFYSPNILKYLHHNPNLTPSSLSDILMVHSSVYFVEKVVLHLVLSTNVEGQWGKMNRVERGGATWVGEMKEQTHQWSWWWDERVL